MRNSTRWVRVARALLGIAVASLPCFALIALDQVLRAPLLAAMSHEARVQYATHAGISSIMWTGIVLAATSASRWVALVARILVASMSVGIVGTQLYTWLKFGTYMSFRTALQYHSLWPMMGGSLPSQRALAITCYGLPAALALLSGAGSARFLRLGRASSALSIAVGLAAMTLLVTRGKATHGWDNGSPPDVLWLSGAGEKFAYDIAHPLERTERPSPKPRRDLPTIQPAQGKRPPNVVVILTESVRAEAVCSVPEAKCEGSPFTNALLPKRLGLTRMRALDSTTAISVAVLSTGESTHSSRATFERAPSLWDFAHAAGYDTAYITSQNLLFANAAAAIDSAPIRTLIAGTALDPYATVEVGASDHLAIELAIRELPRLSKPYFTLVQLSNTHFPYWVEQGERPFAERGRKQRQGVSDERAELRERYRDSVVRQDREVARLVEWVKRQPDAENTVVVFLSDHGEHVWERGIVGHTWTLYDLEIRVPFWLDAGSSALTSDQVAAFSALENVPVTHLDFFPTVIDLFGVHDEPLVRARLAELSGKSLLRAGHRSENPVFLTNCASIYSCQDENWGAILADRKLLFSQEEPGGWKCYDTTRDPEERMDLGVERCADLRTFAEGVVGRPPQSEK